MANKPATRKNEEDFIMETLQTVHDERCSSSFLVEMRRNPRYATSLEAVAVTDASAVAAVIDLSLGGLRLQLDHMAFTALQPDETRPGEHKPFDLTIYFNLPGDPQQQPSVRVIGRTVHTICGTDGLFQIGIIFKSILSGRSELGHYLKYRQAIA